MAVLRVLHYPNKILKTKARAVAEVTADDLRLVKDMIDTMYAESGIGLAANQIGVLRQIFVASPDQVKEAFARRVHPERMVTVVVAGEDVK